MSLPKGIHGRGDGLMLYVEPTIGRYSLIPESVGRDYKNPVPNEARLISISFNRSIVLTSGNESIISSAELAQRFAEYVRGELKYPSEHQDVERVLHTIAKKTKLAFASKSTSETVQTLVSITRDTLILG